MEQAPKANLGRPKLRNIALPHDAVCCFACGLPLLTKGGSPTDEFQVAAVPGIIFFACTEHVDAGKAMCDQNVYFLNAMNKTLSEQKTQTE